MKKGYRNYSDTFLDGTEDWHLNAILPHAQMASSELGYILGYASAVGSLTAVAKAASLGHGVPWEGTYVTIDTVIFPQLFCARHFVELSLKRIIRMARSIGKVKRHVAPKGGHELDAILEEALGEVKEYAPGSLPFVEELRGPILEFHLMDKDGDAFRYARSKSDDLDVPPPSVAVRFESGIYCNCFA